MIKLFELLGTVSVFIPFAFCVGLIFAAIYVTVCYFRRRKMKNDKFLKMRSSMKIVKNTTDGILGVVNCIAEAEQITDWNELYSFILNMDPETFCNYQLAPVHSSELPDAESEEVDL